MNPQAPDYAAAGSQRWLQVAIERAPNLLHEALRPALGQSPNVAIQWRSPVRADHFREYRDLAALRRLGIPSLPYRKLSEFWPQRGPVWDALGNTTDDQMIFVEAKAHLNELSSPASRATPASLERIRKSLDEARQHFAPQSQADWSGAYYQYANRLAHHYLFRTLNGLPSRMIFLYFINAEEMGGPTSKEEWRNAIDTVHSTLGLDHTRIHDGVHELFLDVSPLRRLLSSPDAAHKLATD